MENGNGLVPIDRMNLLLQLDNYKLIAEMNDHLFEDKPLVKEQLTLEFDRLDNYLDQVEIWGGQGEYGKYNLAMTKAKTSLDYIRLLINEILSQ